MSSNFWIFVIILGAVLATIGNIQYNKAIEVENQKEMAEQASSLLLEEFQRNAQTTLSVLGYDGDTFPSRPPYETEAWLTVSKSNLLLGLPNELLRDYIRVYYLFNQANKLISEILYIQNGVGNAMAGAKETKLGLLSEFKVSSAKAKELLIKMKFIEANDSKLQPKTDAK